MSSRTSADVCADRADVETVGFYFYRFYFSRSSPENPTTSRARRRLCRGSDKIAVVAGAHFFSLVFLSTGVYNIGTPDEPFYYVRVYFIHAVFIRFVFRPVTTTVSHDEEDAARRCIIRTRRSEYVERKRKKNTYRYRSVDD